MPPFGEVVHVSIYGLKVKSALSPTGISPSILLQPFSGAPLRASLKQRVTREIPPDVWRFAFQSLSEKHQGHQLIPVLMPVKEFVAGMERPMRPKPEAVGIGGGRSERGQGAGQALVVKPSAKVEPLEFSSCGSTNN